MILRCYPFFKELRFKERKSIEKMAYVQALSFGISFILTYIAPVATIIVAVYRGENVTLPKVRLLGLFVSLFIIVYHPNLFKLFFVYLNSLTKVREIVRVKTTVVQVIVRLFH